VSSSDPVDILNIKLKRFKNTLKVGAPVFLGILGKGKKS
jgi:hypothetical protein